MRSINKPSPSEYPEYSKIYIDLASNSGNVLQLLRQNQQNLKDIIFNLPEEKLLYKYDVNKWTIKEILVHLIDDERIYAYRALRFARNDKTELPGFDEKNYVVFSNAKERTIESIFTEYNSVREATISLFENFPEEALLRTGIAEGKTNERSVRAYIYHIAGHELHHINIIKQKYLICN